MMVLNNETDKVYHFLKTIVDIVKYFSDECFI